MNCSFSSSVILLTKVSARRCAAADPNAFIAAEVGAKSSEKSGTSARAATHTAAANATAGHSFFCIFVSPRFCFCWNAEAERVRQVHTGHEGWRRRVTAQTFACPSGIGTIGLTVATLRAE